MLNGGFSYFVSFLRVEEHVRVLGNIQIVDVAVVCIKQHLLILLIVVNVQMVSVFQQVREDWPTPLAGLMLWVQLRRGVEV